MDIDIPNFKTLKTRRSEGLTLFCLAMRQVSSRAVLSGLEDLTTTDMTGSEIQEIITSLFNVLFNSFSTNNKPVLLLIHFKLISVAHYWV